MQVSKELQVSGSILGIEDQGYQVVLISSHYKIFCIDRANLEVSEEINVVKDKEPLHQYSRAMGLSKKGYFNIPMPGKKISVLLSNDPKVRKVGVNKSHNGDVEASCFSDDSKFLATGGNDGKVYVFEVPSVEMVASIPSRPDFSHMIHISRDREMLASCSYDKNVYLFNIDRHKPVASFFANDVVQVSQFFSNNERFYFATRSGASVIFDLRNKKTLNIQKHFEEWPTAIAMTEDERFVLVGTRKDKIHIIRLEDNANINTLQLKKLGVTNIRILPEFLLVTFEDGTIHFYDLFNHLSSMEVELKLKKYGEAAKYLERNRLLLLHPSAKRFDEAWEGVFSEFKQLVSVDKMIEAMKLVRPFLADATRKQQMDEYMESKENAIRFNQFVRKKDFVNALILAGTVPELKTLPQYEHVNQFWQKLFASSKKALMENPQGNRGKVEMKLAPYKRVPSLKNTINTLLESPQLFSSGEKLIRAKKFTEYFKLAQEKPVLQESDIHKRILSLMEKLQSDYEKAMDNEEYDHAEEVATALMEFPPFALKMKEEIIKIKQVRQLGEAMLNQDYKMAFKIIELYPSLRNTSIYKEHRSTVENIFTEAGHLASKGKIRETSRALGMIEGIPYYNDKVRSLKKFSYLSFLENALGAGSKKTAKQTIAEYLNKFGKDDDIKVTCARLEVEHILERADSL